MEINDVTEITITDITSAGWGVGRVSAEEHGDPGVVVFVPFTAPGEVVEARITEKRKNHYRAELVDLVKPGPHRINPSCRYFGNCPGCSLSFMEYPAQLDAKCARALELYRRKTEFDFQSPKIIGSPEEYGYRTHISIKFEKKDDHTAIGLTDPSTRRVFDIEECLIMPEWGRETYWKLRERLLGLKFKSGTLRFRLFFDHAQKVTYVVSPRGAGSKDKGNSKLLDKILDGFPQPGTIRHEVLGIPLYFHPSGFLQANYFVMEDLYVEGLAAVDARPDDVLFEIYSGNGFYTLALADRVKRAVALEVDRESCNNLSRSANEMLTERRVEGKREPDIEIAQGRAEDLTADIIRDLHPTIVLANPPRSGLHVKALESIVDSRDIRSLVMVSCDPGTCARDAKILVKSGFNPRTLSFVDCYPQTSHIETVIGFERG